MALTLKDEKRVREIVREEVSEQFSNYDEKMDTKLSRLKSDLFEKIDPVLKEVLTARDERPLIESRLEALEEIHRKGDHSIPN